LGYIEKNLMEGERVIATARLHPIVFVGPALLTLLVFLLFINNAAWLAILPLIWLGLVFWGLFFGGIWSNQSADYR